MELRRREFVGMVATGAAGLGLELELQVIENVQRVDVHPLDEPQRYAALIELQPDTYTVENIASRVGRSPAYVSERLRLIQQIQRFIRLRHFIEHIEADSLFTL